MARRKARGRNALGWIGGALVAIALGAAMLLIDRTPAAATVPEALRVRILKTYPHARNAFTQGLLWHRGRLYESTGLEGSSSVREVELETGKVRRQVPLDASLFGEGLARVGDRLIQLTWKNEQALVWTLPGFEKKGTHAYRGEGWGLCHDGRHLIMSDGSEFLTFRDPATFEAEKRIRVTRIGLPVRRLNELECVEGAVWANIWQTDQIVRIDPKNGNVTATVDASGLLDRADRVGADVLNGIAFIPERKSFVITGKHWPKAFEVRFVPRKPGQ